MFIKEAADIIIAPLKIISLVPSLTELLSYLDLEKETVGITKFCIHPASWRATKPVIGGTKNVNLSCINEIEPDLVIANREENVKDQIEQIAEEYPVWLTDVNTFEQALGMIRDIGIITHRRQLAENLLLDITKAFQELKPAATNFRTAYLIWKNPLMAAGGHNFINDLLCKCGLLNIFDIDARYPVIEVKDLFNKKCELLLLSSEPYPFKEEHLQQLQRELPGTKIIFVDGELFSWYGSRLLLAPAYFNDLLKIIA